MYLFKDDKQFYFCTNFDLELFWLVFVRVCVTKNNTESGTYILNNIVDEDKTHYNFL